MRKTSLSVFVGAMLVLVLQAVPAQAQATRTWVSGVGDDANPCSRTAPCKTFAGAISKTAVNGEINCLDPAGYGAVTITKAMAIVCQFTEGGVLVGAGNGINVSDASPDSVLLEGLDFQGSGVGTQGVSVSGGAKVTIRDCIIRGFTQYGVNLVGTAGARVFITRSFISGNAVGGFLVQGSGGAANSGILDSTTIDSNGPSSVKLGPGASFTVSGSVLTGSANAIDATAGGTVTSYANSVMRPAPTINTPLPLL